MAYSSILGADRAPQEPSGRGADRLGPSDNSDSGSDAIGTTEAHEESTDAFGTGERGAVAGPDPDAGDILPDRVVNLSEGQVFASTDPDELSLTDLDDGSADEEDEDGTPPQAGAGRAQQAKR